MSTYVPKNSRIPHKKLNFKRFETPEIKRKRVLFWGATVIFGPVLLVGGLCVVWWAVAWIIVFLFKYPIPTLLVGFGIFKALQFLLKK